MPDWLIPVIVIDLIVTIGVVAFVVRRRNRQMSAHPPGPGVLAGLREMTTFVNERHQRIGEYLRGNWSGAPDQLPGVLGSLLTELEREALAGGIPFDRDLLKTLIATSLRYHKIGHGSEVQKALEQVA